MATGKGLDNIVPQHPLPEEIRKMQRDDTVCKFCGVSYLIHNEIKNLEDKLKAAEDELKHYRGMEEREENLKYELRKLKMDLEASSETIQAKDAIIGTLNASIKLKDDEVRIIENARKLLEDKLREVTQVAETFKLKHGLLMSNLPTVLNTVRNQKKEYESLKELVRERDSVLAKESEAITTALSEKCSQLKVEAEKVNIRVLDLQKKVDECQGKEKQLKSEIQTRDSEIEKLNQSQTLQGEMQVECQALKGKVKALEVEIESIQSMQRSASMESEQYKEQMRKQSQEIESLNEKINSRQSQSDQVIDRLRKELNHKEFDIDAVKRELANYRRRYEEQQRLGQEIQERASTSNTRIEEMKERMDRAVADAEALKKEREMMITAHQNQIEQLRESFKKRISEADKWPERMEATIMKERRKHMSEMGSLEARLKENFVMELKIEKEKHEALLEKYQSENKDSEQNLRYQLQGIGSKHKSEIGELHKQIAETKARSREVENNLRKEVENLKSIIRDLEGRLGKVQEGVGQEKLLGVKTQLIETQTALENKNQECKKIETQLATAKEEIGFLQETVRRECEERFQLTEALSQCKEDLLAYRKPPGGYSSARPNSGHSVRSSASRSEEIALYKKASSRTPQPPGARQSAPNAAKDSAMAPNVSVGFEGDGARKGGGNLSEQRKRIAQAVGRT